MTIQHFHKNTIRHKKNSEWLQGSGNPVKPENDTKVVPLLIGVKSCYHKKAPLNTV